MRTPHRIDILQPLYFCSADLKRFFELYSRRHYVLAQQAMKM
jgi:phenylalanine-4-hydroxylase